MYVCLLLLAATALQGQSFRKALFAGVTASQVDGDFYTGYNKIGLTAGAWLNQSIKYDLNWQAEVKYVMRGVYKGPDDNDPSIYKSSYHYVELPLSIQYLFEEKVAVEAGLSPEVLLWAQFSDGNGIIDPSLYPDNRRFGLSVFGGVVYWFWKRVGMGIRYTYSVIPFRDPQEWNHPRYRGYYHDVICLTLALKMGTH